MKPQSVTEAVAGNVRAERMRCRLEQRQLCDRMRGLGHATWHPQTVSEVEHGRRPLRADELLSLAAALETEPSALLRVTAEARLASPNGIPYAAFTSWRADGKPVLRMAAAISQAMELDR